MSVRYSLSNLNLVYVRTNPDYETTNGICEICKKSLYMLPSDINSVGGIEKTKCKTPNNCVIIGRCHHAFHLQCFPHGSVSCPIDDTVWQTAYKIVDV
jgi:hypothetical protein